jgi:hemerythrin-like domain-containing protein
MSAEEEYIYPVLEKDDKIKGDAVKARDQHAAAQAQLDKVDPNSDDATFKAQVSVLRELIEDHVQYEEDKLLSRAEQIISPEDQKRINEDFKQSYSDGGWF